MSFNKENYSFHSLEDLEQTQKLRAPHKRIVGLAEKSVLDSLYKDAIVYYEQVRRFLHAPDAKQKLEQNIENLLHLGRDEEAPLPPQQQLPSPPPSSFQKNNPNEMQITIDNIQVSGIQMSGGEKAVEALGKMFHPNLNPSEIPQLENTIQQELEHQIHQESRIVEEQIYQDVIKRKNSTTEESAEKTEQIEENSDKSTSPPEKSAIASDTDGSNEGKTEVSDGEEGSGSGSGSNEDLQDNPFKQEGGGNQEPIKVEQVKSKPKVEKSPVINLTYNFSNIFHNKFYLKYEDMFNEAAKLVKDKKLDEAIDYYNVLLDQKLPETMKLMIQQNINDLRTTILNTFRQSNTIVKLDESGKPVVMDSDTITVFEHQLGQDDVYFKDD